MLATGFDKLWTAVAFCIRKKKPDGTGLRPPQRPPRSLPHVTGTPRIDCAHFAQAACMGAAAAMYQTLAVEPKTLTERKHEAAVNDWSPVCHCHFAPAFPPPLIWPNAQV